MVTSPQEHHANGVRQPHSVDRVRLPRRAHTPLAQVLRRVGAALALVASVALVVRLGRDGYVDETGDPIGFLDAFYYASVTVTTTGYGDITAITQSARLATILLITPARILFLILVVGTTVEVLTDQSRQLMLTRRWRKNVKNHYIICGYGSTGQSVVRDLLTRGVSPDKIVVADIEESSMEAAAAAGIVGILGDASQRSVLQQAGIEDAQAVIVVPNRDDTAVLITLTAREMNPTVHIVAGGREQENLHLLTQGGADQVIDATATLGRMLGLGTLAPDAGQVLHDILDAGSGMELAQMSVGRSRGAIPDDVTVVAVVRNHRRLRPEEVDLSSLRSDDELIVLREHTER